MSLFPEYESTGRHEPDDRVRAPITGSVLLWARTIGGFSRDELASVIGRAGRPDVIQRWELEQEFPTMRQLEAVANKLKRSIAVFFLPFPPSEPDPEAAFQRTVSLQSHGFSSELRLAIRTARYVRDRFGDVIDTLGESTECKIPIASVDDNAEDVAKEARKIVDISVADQCRWPNDHAYDLWMEALVPCGVLSQQFSAPIEEGWGFAITDGELPVVAVNRKVRTKNGKIFTLWHEVGHVALRDSSVSIIEFGSQHQSDQDVSAKTERWCNLFSASFLMPLDSPEVQEALEKIRVEDDLDGDRIQRAATKFRVSKYVFLGRMREVDLIPEDKYSTLRSQWWALDTAREKERLKKQKEKQAEKERKGGLSAWKDSMADRGRPLAHRVFSALRRGAISDSDAADILGIDVNSFDKAEQALLAREPEE